MKDHSEMPVNHQHSGKNVLLLIMELPRWKCGRSVSYCSQLGLEEALQSNGVETFTITTPWFPRLDELCAGRRFDQIWIDIVHSWQGPKIFDQTNFLEKLVELAPIRLGLLPESLTYDAEEIVGEPALAARFSQVVSRSKCLTHIATSDEKDAEYFGKVLGLPAIWCPPAVLQRFISQNFRSNPNGMACFCGAVYGTRKTFFEHECLKELLANIRSPERYSFNPFLYNLNHYFSLVCRSSNFLTRPATLSAYMRLLKSIRNASFNLWLDSLAQGCCVVNLPHNVKTYSGRVVEAMASGSPVISWEIQDRPKNSSLFVNFEEILLFHGSDRDKLADQIQLLKTNTDLAKTIVRNARNKIMEFHTLELRAQQLLAWIDKGREPVYY
jgi:hypothetical protein